MKQVPKAKSSTKCIKQAPKHAQKCKETTQTKPAETIVCVKTLRKRAISAAYHTAFAESKRKTGDAELAKEEARAAYAAAAAKFDEEHKQLE